MIEKNVMELLIVSFFQYFNIIIESASSYLYNLNIHPIYSTVASGIIDKGNVHVEKKEDWNAVPRGKIEMKLELRTVYIKMDFRYV